MKSIQFIDKSGKTIKNVRELNILNNLITIWEIWNSIDNFTPDFSIGNSQVKYFPLFKITNGKVICTGSYRSYATFCPIAYRYRNKFAFKTEERAEQFGNQFINIINEFFSNLFIYKIKMIIP